jgi:hypothetical protein
MTDGADLAYDPRARRRPGASPVTLRVYAALVEHAGEHGLTVDEIEALVRDGFPTDSYRAYQRVRNRNRVSTNRALIDTRLEFGTEDFRRRARRWAVGVALTRMRKCNTARRHSSQLDRWLPGDRAPTAQTAWEVRPQRTEPIVTTYDPAGDRAKMERYHAESRAIANAKTALGKSKLRTAEAHDVIRELLALLDQPPLRGPSDG